MAKKRKTELDIETGAIPVPPPPSEPAAPAVSLEQEMAQDAASARQPGKPLNKNAVIAAGAVMAIVLAVVIAVTVVQKKKSSATAKKADVHGEKAKDAEKHKTEEVKFEKLNNLVLEPFVIPYKNKGQDGFIQIVFALQVDDPDVINEISNNLPLIRNSILFAINTHSSADLIDPAKRETLMKDIRFNIDRSLQSGRVVAILLNAINVY